MRRPRSLLAFVLAGGLAACAAGAPPIYQPSETPDAVVRSGDFTLKIASPSSHWPLDWPITVTATLSYDGATPTTVIGAGTGLISFGVREIGGTREMSASFTSDSVPNDISPDAPIVDENVKSGGRDTGSDPNTSFYEAFFADPEFRLPAGQWEVNAGTRFAPEEGGPYSVDMWAGLVLTVE